MPLACTALESESRFSSPKNLGTLQTRQRYYLEVFTKEMKLLDNPYFTGYSQSTRNLIMASYAIYLLAGQNLVCRTIKSGTVKQYLSAVTKLFTSMDVMDPCLDKYVHTNRFLKAVYKEATHWESMPNRAEPLTMDMVQFFITQAKSASFTSSDSAIANWAILGLHTGYRISEFGQTHSGIHLPAVKGTKITTNVDGTAKAFIPEDFTFYSKKRSLQPIKKISSLSRIHTADICFRFQKNLDNDQIITLARNYKHPDMCPVQAMLRICRKGHYPPSATRLASGHLFTYQG